MKVVPNNIFRTGLRWYYVRRSRENNLIDKNNKLQPKQNYHSKSSEKNRKIKKIIRKEQENQKKADDEPTHRQEVKNIMKIRTANDIKEFNVALDKCTHPVWLMGPNDECYNMKNEEEYIEGMIKLTEGHDDQLGIFTDSYDDEMTMLKFFKQMAA